MKKKYLISGATIINEGRAFIGSVLINNGLIKLVAEGIFPPEGIEGVEGAEIIDAEGKWLIPGVIDDQVHFREPGLTHKGDNNPHMADGNLGHGNLFYIDKPGVQVPGARE